MVRVEDRRTGRQWASLAQFLEYVRSTQHAYLRLMVPHLSRLQARLATESTLDPARLDQVGRQLLSLMTALAEHVHRQEDWLFEELRRVYDQGPGDGLSEQAKQELRRMHQEHRRLLALVDEALATVRAQTCSGHDGLLAELVRDLEHLKARLEEHQRLETRVLLPTIGIGAGYVTAR